MAFDFSAAPVQAAIITGSCAVGSALLTVVFTRLWEQRDFQIISQPRRKTLSGAWAGTYDQEVGPEGPFRGDITLLLVTKRKIVTGECTIKAPLRPSPFTSSFAVNGGYYHDRFLSLEYRNPHAATVHFGSLLLELTARGTLRGRYLGFGAVTEKLVYGTIELSRNA